jgi:hypothetical protein
MQERLCESRHVEIALMSKQVMIGQHDGGVQERHGELLRLRLNEDNRG